VRIDRRMLVPSRGVAEREKEIRVQSLIADRRDDSAGSTLKVLR